MGLDRGDCMSAFQSSDDEEGYTSSNYFRSSLNICKKKNSLSIIGEAIPLRKFYCDDTDQQFWAEDELSSSDSRSIMFKHKRRHSIAHRNHEYRSISRLNRTSSSSSYLSSGKIPPVRRRRKQRVHRDKYPIIILRSSNNSARRNIIKKNCYVKIRLLRNRKKL